MGQSEFDVVLVGGCGHVGLPLGLALADMGLQVALFDVSARAVEQVNSGIMPFLEPGTQKILRDTIGKNLVATVDEHTVGSAPVVIVIIGTPVDEHQNPEPHKVVSAVRAVAKYLTSDQLLILRSTVYPGTTALIEGMLADLDVMVDVAFCPERIAEGKAMEELRSLPQIVASHSEAGLLRASEFFGQLTNRIVTMTPEEAELAKLFTNTWRYIKFAAANQLFMMAENFGLSYEKIRQGLSEEYPRAADLPRAGFAAGPCLLKDTLQLASFNNNDFMLGHAAVGVNEGLPLFVTSRLSQRYPLHEMTVGILGMAFKQDSDDARSSLAYKLKKILRYRSKEVIATDPFVQSDPSLLPLEVVLARSDLLILGAPHGVYRELRTSLPVVDIWSFFGMDSGL
ncbi:MAG: nucleotide sugar dehydrogenase [Ferrimicrobium sp.]